MGFFLGNEDDMKGNTLSEHFEISSRLVCIGYLRQRPLCSVLHIVLFYTLQLVIKEHQIGSFGK